MATMKTPVMGLPGWLLHRLTANYWLLPTLAVLAAPVAGYGLVALDRGGLAADILAADLLPVVNGDTAKDLVNVAIGVDVALLAVFFNITLLVLTIAAGNLGVRLIDRWLDKPLIRVSIAGLAFSVVFGLAVSAAIDGDATGADVPLGAVWALLLLQLVDIAMLCVALHDLGRAIFIDREIDYLGQAVEDEPAGITGGDGHDGPWAMTVFARQEGYVEGIDTDRAAGLLRGHAGGLRFLVAPGQHVLKGEPIACAARPGLDADRIAGLVPIGPYRSDTQGAVFRIRLLVEIGARAMSPAVNDFYTAIACADRLAQAMAGACERWVDGGQTPLLAAEPLIELPGQDFAALFDDPLKAFRQSAADYPPVAIRMIDNYARLARRFDNAGAAAGLAGFLRAHAGVLADHAQGRAQTDADRRDIAAALANCDDAVPAP